MMGTKASAKAKMVIPFSPAFYGSLILMWLLTISKEVRMAGADDDHRTPGFSARMENTNFSFLTNEGVGCSGRGMDVYRWRNVGWGSNTNSELDTTILLPMSNGLSCSGVWQTLISLIILVRIL